MKTHLATVALAAALTQPAAAITFPSLTTIYVGAGVTDDASLSSLGTATVFHCMNVSGVGTVVRFLVLRQNGAAGGSYSTAVDHGETITVATHDTAFHNEEAWIASGQLIIHGGINIESLQSGVFCNAMAVDAAAPKPVGVTLPLVRVNPHPGTVE